MAVTLPAIKQGDTFYYTAVWAGAQVSELKSQVKDDFGELISDVEIYDSGTADTFVFKVADTSNWPIATLYTDIQRTTLDGTIQSSDTMTIQVLKDVTR